ncbi:MAG TPA: EamA family transporter, partial [Gammaproteobacteria bacterium]|nr:EamA family transporter [Gammaproteobacteria bacterium]
MSLRDLLLAALVPLTWGVGFTIAKAGLEEFPPVFLMGLRFCLA